MGLLLLSFKNGVVMMPCGCSLAIILWVEITINPKLEQAL